jgi:hypothetical protein
MSFTELYAVTYYKISLLLAEKSCKLHHVIGEYFYFYLFKKNCYTYLALSMGGYREEQGVE